MDSKQKSIKGSLFTADYLAWLLRHLSSAMPRSTFSKDFQYTLNFWSSLELYVESDYLKPDNNDIKRNTR